MRHFDNFGSQGRCLRKKRLDLTMQEVIGIFLSKYAPIKPVLLRIKVLVIPRFIVEQQHDLLSGGQRLHRVTRLQKPY